MSYTPWYKGRTFLIATVVSLLFVVAIVGGCSQYYADSQVTVNLRDKNIVPTGKDGHDYRLNTDLVDGGNETFVIEDSIVKGQLNTGDIYFRLHEGRKYGCDAYGWRVPLLSSFRALHNCKDLGPADPQAGR